MAGKRNIDIIIESVKKEFPTVGVWQLKVKNKYDDDGIWYFWLDENEDDEIHVENSYGQCPFSISTLRNNEMIWGNTVEETVEIICQHLRTSKIK